jgi:hypothetical protein
VDVKTGRAGKKVTRHEHTYRGLFRCGLCGGAMTPEIQKGHTYYRCQRRTCETTTVREEALDEAVVTALLRLAPRPEDAASLRANWIASLETATSAELLRSCELRIDAAEARLARLTDLLIDGAIDREEHATRRRALTLELRELEDERRRATETRLSPAQVERFLELLTSLAELHGLANRLEKRLIVQNAFSNRTVSRKEVYLEPSNWLTEREISRLSPMVTHDDTLIELLYGLRIVNHDDTNT